ncbi:MAG: transcription termination factor NusA [Oscillospiraceae bacterium]|nr:transcription termination factor NusA [Oscillospiraceae bacterium]
MNQEFFAALEALEVEKGIPKDYLLEKVETALLTAFKKETDGGIARVHIDPEKKDIRVFRQMEVVEEVLDPLCQITLEDAHKISKRYKLGSIVEKEHKTKQFGRLSAQSAKQVIIQGIREAERGMMIQEYESKSENIITAVVQKVDPSTGNLVLDTGTSYATLLKAEQIPTDNFDVNDHIKVFITEVKKESRGPLVTLSRTHPNFVKRLFELEIPEVESGLVTIENVVREAGSRTKVAVDCPDGSIDPVGACIGNRGMRINRIMDEMSGERVDVIRYSANPAEYIRAALSPASTIEVIIADERNSRVVVDPSHLSLAIGKEGQNVRLAAKLTGYKIDIKTDRYD